MQEIILRVHDDAVKTVVEFMGLCPQVEVVSCSPLKMSPRLTDAILAKAVEGCLGLFWAASAWAVVYRVLQTCYGEERSVDRFEKDMARLLPNITRKCNNNTVQAAMINNPILREKVEDWESRGANCRIIQLRDALKVALDSLLR